MKQLQYLIVLLLVTIITITIVGYKIINTSLKLSQELRETQWELDSSINSKQVNNYPPRDYQLEVVEDTIILFDGNRLVGTFKLDYDADPVSTLIEEDNQ